MRFIWNGINHLVDPSQQADWWTVLIPRLGVDVETIACVAAALYYYLSVAADDKMIGGKRKVVGQAGPIYRAGQFILFLMLKGRDLLGIHSIQSSYTQHHLHSLTNIKN